MKYNEYYEITLPDEKIWGLNKDSLALLVSVGSWKRNCHFYNNGQFAIFTLMLQNSFIITVFLCVGGGKK